MKAAVPIALAAVLLAAVLILGLGGKAPPAPADGQAPAPSAVHSLAPDPPRLPNPPV